MRKRQNSFIYLCPPWYPTSPRYWFDIVAGNCRRERRNCDEHCCIILRTTDTDTVASTARYGVLHTPTFDAYSQPLSRYARSRIQRSQTQLLLCCASHVVHSCNSNLSHANLPNQPSKSLYADECVNGTPN